MRRLIGAAAVGLSGLVLAGCASQIAALGPVSGDAAFSVRTAAIDVLLASDVTIGRAPTCATDAAGITCTGTVADGQPVTVTAAGKKPVTMVVMVGEDVVYDGSIQDVLDEAARRTGGIS